MRLSFQYYHTGEKPEFPEYIKDYYFVQDVFLKTQILNAHKDLSQSFREKTKLETNAAWVNEYKNELVDIVKKQVQQDHKAIYEKVHKQFNETFQMEA